MIRKCLLALLMLAGLAGRAQQDDSLMIRRIADEILVHGQAYDNLRVLCKTMGGRLAGSPQMVKAEAWGKKTLDGLQADSVWLQSCQVPHWVRGGKDQAYFRTSPNGPRINLDILALGNSVGTGRAGISAPVILIRDFNDLEAKKDLVKDKIVYYDYAFNPRFINTFEAYGDAVKYRAAGPSRAARYGAKAVLIRSMSHSTDNNPHTGSTRYSEEAPKIPAAAIGLKDADKLAAALRSGKEVSAYLRTLAHTLPDTVGHNVIAEWKGTEFPDEIITIGGHLDSWDPAEGAHDDGAGCVQSIEVLRALKAIGYRPRHTIRVVLFANEENGTRGGRAYADEARQKQEKMIFALESDDGGFTPRAFSFTLAPEKLQRARAWIPLLQPYGVYEFRDGGGGADIGPLQSLGTPLAGLTPDSQRYFDYHHSRNDVFENVNKRELELGAINMAALIYLVDKYGL